LPASSLSRLDVITFGRRLIALGLVAMVGAILRRALFRR
jgi:hypothetical protein